MSAVEVKALKGYFSQWSYFQSDLSELYEEGFVVTHMSQGEGKIAVILEREREVDE